MNYDFSKINTEDLRLTVDNAGDRDSYSDFCYNISCNKCPFYNILNINNSHYCKQAKEMIKKLFKEELSRRIKMENKMPELEVGMVVEAGNGERFIVLSKDNGELGFYNKEGRNYFVDPVKIYKKYENCSYYSFIYSYVISFLDDFCLIWEKDNKRKLEIAKEIEKYKAKIEQLEKELKEN